MQTSHVHFLALSVLMCPSLIRHGPNMWSFSGGNQTISVCIHPWVLSAGNRFNMSNRIQVLLTLSSAPAAVVKFCTYQQTTVNILRRQNTCTHMSTECECEWSSVVNGVTYFQASLYVTEILFCYDWMEIIWNCIGVDVSSEKTELQSNLLLSLTAIKAANEFVG